MKNSLTFFLMLDIDKRLNIQECSIIFVIDFYFIKKKLRFFKINKVKIFFSFFQDYKFNGRLEFYNNDGI